VSSDKARKQAVRAIMTETGMKYMAAMRELERREAVAESAEAAARPEPIGWNVYEGGGDLANPRFREFVPNERALAPVAEAFADDVERWARNAE
jgi:hypothetical protein